MASYNQRLRELTARRDAALAGLMQNGEAGAGIASDHVKDAFVTQVEHTKTAIVDQFEGLKNNLNPANIIRAHPWATTIGALVAGIAVVRLINMRRDTSDPEPDSTTASPPNEVIGERQMASQPWWKPLCNALVAELQQFAIEFVKRQLSPAVAAPSEASADSREPLPISATRILKGPSNGN